MAHGPVAAVNAIVGMNKKNIKPHKNIRFLNMMTSLAVKLLEIPYCHITVTEPGTQGVEGLMMLTPVKVVVVGGNQLGALELVITVVPWVTNNWDVYVVSLSAVTYRLM
jgi:hypothetical protein